MNARARAITAEQPAELRAAGTDLSERRRSGVSRGRLIDVQSSPDMKGVAWDDSGAARIGALTSIAEVANDPRVADAYPGLAGAAKGLATPQIRHVATVGGNLAQRSRCWYYRNPQTMCLKKGDPICPARAGNHLYGVAFDLGPCVAPHPSTLAAALLAYDATVMTNLRAMLAITDLLGDGSNGLVDNLLQPGEIIKSVHLPPPLANERALYKRAISRSRAEWPLVEIVARATISDGSFELLRLVAGGVAPVPLRLFAAEAAAQGAPVNQSTIAEMANQALSGAMPLPMTRYKLALMKGLVRDVFERLLLAECGHE
ncbi:FAD binding domain-containing protein [Lysobacter sp. CA199]|uniref:FAD binding domain-containing protein n=1 Tax=Lysobacter sp. CA199 TaxID=3455608 RepID=UPI003F8D805B